jgi:hypothetical protein
VIEHIPEDTSVLAEMREALRPRGGALIAVPQHPYLWSSVDELSLHQRRYRRGELETKARAAGFDVVATTSFNAVLLPLAFVSRFRGRFAEGGNRTDLSAVEIRPPQIVNSLLRVVLEAEVALTLLGIRWPAGTSRIVVLRRV